MSTGAPGKRQGTWARLRQWLSTKRNNLSGRVNRRLDDSAKYLSQKLSYLWGGVRSRIGGLFTWMWKKDSEHLKNLAEVAFLIVGAIWAVWTFTWQDRLKPLQGPPELTLTTQLEQTGVQDKSIALKAKLTVKNSGKTRVKVLSAYFNLIGYKLERFADNETNDPVYLDTVNRKIMGDEPKKPESGKPMQADPPCGGRYDKEIDDSRYFMRCDRTFINSGSLLLESWLEPEEQYTRDYVFFVPEKTHDLVRLQFDIYVIKDAQFIEWKKVEQYAKGRSRVCKTGELDVDIQVKPYCRFCDLNNVDWKSFWDYDSTFRKEFREEHSLAHTDSLFDLSLRAPLSPAPPQTTEKDGATTQRPGTR